MPERVTPQRDLGATGVKVPLIGYGTAPLGKTDKIPVDQGVACLNRAIDLGITSPIWTRRRTTAASRSSAR